MEKVRVFIDADAQPAIEPKTWVYHPSSCLVYKYYINDDYQLPTESIFTLDQLLAFVNWIELKEVKKNANSSEKRR